jgi:hypothetical protein
MDRARRALTLADRMVTLTLDELPSEVTHWTAEERRRRSMSLRSVQWSWGIHHPQPHRVGRFKLSQDLAFVTKAKRRISAGLDASLQETATCIFLRGRLSRLCRTQR